MKSIANILLVITCLLTSIHNRAQTIAKHSFESSGETWLPLNFSTPPCSSNNDIWNYVTSLPSITPSDGNRFWGIRDLDGNCGGTGFETITFPNISTAGTDDVVFSFDYNAINFDTNEDLKYELFYDNISQGEVIVVNGIPGSSDNTNGWKSEFVNVPNSVNNVSVILSARCNRNNERAGFDNVKLAVVSASTDTCSGAAPLTVYSAGASSGNETSATTSNATASAMSNTSCDSFTSNQNIDQFYTFTVPAGQTSINVLTGGATGNDINVALWDSCNGVELYCSNNDSSFHQINGLTPNTTYTLQVWHDDFNIGDFTIALETPAPPPSNDNCLTATTLTVGANNTQNVVTGSNISATNSGITPTPSCAAYNGNDIWYEALIPSSGILIVETLNAGSNIDTGLAVYTGSCNNLIQQACDDDSGPGLYSTITLTGLPNTTVKIRVWAYNNSSIGNFNIVAYSPDCLDSTTWSFSGWSNGTPNASKSAIINRNYDTGVSGSFETCNCQINNNRTVNIRANDYITVNNDLNVLGTLEVRNEGSLVMVRDDGNVTSSGNIRVYKTSNSFQLYDYNYWSSPVIGETIGNVFSASPSTNIFRFNTSVFDSSHNSGWTAVSGSTTMAAGTGYIAMGTTSGSFPQTQSIVFEGLVHNGVIEKSISLSADSGDPNDDWNLIGNPYPSAIDADILLNDPQNGAVGNTIYLWTHNTVVNQNNPGYDYNQDDYATYTVGVGGVRAYPGGEIPTGKIASGQGFFIEAVSNGILTFNNSSRVETGNDQYFRPGNIKPNNTKTAVKTSKKDRIWLNLSNDDGAFNQLLIGFIPEGTNGRDGYDGQQFGGGNVAFYSVIEDNHFAVNGMAPLTDNTFIPLGYIANIDVGQKLKIDIESLEGVLENTELNIILIDKLTQTEHDLRTQGYEFIISENGTFDNRFELFIGNKSTTLGVDDELLRQQLIISNSVNELQIAMTNSELINEVKLFDMQGRIIYNKKSPKSKYLIDTQRISKGSVLIVQAILDDNRKINKKAIVYK